MRILFSGNKNNRSTGSLGGEQFLHFKAVQIRHMHVEYHAIGHERRIRVKQIDECAPRRKYRCVHSVQRQQTLYCPADEFIVIDYCDERPVPFRIDVYFPTSARDVMRAGQASSGALRIAGREDPVWTLLVPARTLNLCRRPVLTPGAIALTLEADSQGQQGTPP
jgi:hypothetical protein